MSACSQFAQTEDVKEPLKIKSDVVTSTLSGKTHLSGNVSITQGTLEILADEVIVTRDEVNPEKTEISAQGTPVRFQAVEPEPVSATANRVSFKPLDFRLVLEGQVELSQAANTVRGDRIEYDIMKGEIVAASAPDGDQIEILLDLDE